MATAFCYPKTMIKGVLEVNAGDKVLLKRNSKLGYPANAGIVTEVQPSFVMIKWPHNGPQWSIPTGVHRELIAQVWTECPSCTQSMDRDSEYVLCLRCRYERGQT